MTMKTRRPAKTDWPRKSIRVGLAFLISLAMLPANAEELLVFGPYHRGWAHSLDKNLKLLFVTGEPGLVDAREIAAQMDADSEFLNPQDAESFEDMKREVERADVVVFSMRTWGQLEKDQQAAILESCGQGRGLVALGRHTDGEMFGDAIEWSPNSGLEALPEFVDGPSLSWRSATHGDGRILVGSHPVDSTFHTLVPVIRAPALRSKRFFDYQLANVVRGILWAGSIETPAHIKSLKRLEAPPPSASEIPPQLPPEYMQYMADAQMKSSLEVIQLELDAPATDDLSVSVRVRRVDDPRDWEAPAISVVPKGARYAALHLPLGRGQVLLDVWLEEDGDVLDWKSMRVIVERWPMLQNVEFDKHLVKPNDSLEIEYEVRQNLFAPAATFAHTMVIDAIDRVITYTVDTIPPEGGRMTSRIVWSDAMTRSLRVDVFLSQGNAKSLSPLERRMASHASTRLVVQQDDTRGLRWIIPHSALSEPYIHGTFEMARRQGVNVVHTQFEGGAETAALESDLDSLATYPPLEESLGSESACFATPKWRQQQYDIATRWARWAIGNAILQVALPWGIGNTEGCGCDACVELLQNRLRSYYPNLDALNAAWSTAYSTWSSVVPANDNINVAMRTDVARAHHDILELADDEVTRMLTESRPEIVSSVLFDEVDSPIAGERVSRIAMSIGPEDSMDSRRLRSYRSTGHSTGLWSSAQDANGQLPWRALFAGHSAVYTPAALADDAEFRESMARARDGFDSLLLRSQPQDAVIGIYENAATYSIASDRERSILRRTHKRICRTLEDLNLPYQFFSYAQLVSNGAERSSIILAPRVKALSYEEADALKLLAEGGASIVTDAETGRLNEHGVSAGDSSLNVGAILDFDDSESLQIALRTVLDERALEGLAPPLHESMRADAVEWRRFQFGAADIFAGLQRDADDPERPVIALDDERYGYDLIASELVIPRKATLSVNDWGASLFSVLPYRVSRIVVEAPGAVEAGQRLPFRLTVKTFDDLPDTHLLQARLIGPQGETLAHYDSTVVCQNGTGQGYLPLALNDTLGDYTLLVRDVLTGVTASVTVRIV